MATGWGKIDTEKIVCDLQFPRGGASVPLRAPERSTRSGEEADEAAEQAQVG